MRNLREAARRVAEMSDEDILLFATHDPNIFRDVAKLALAVAPVPKSEGS